MRRALACFLIAATFLPACRDAVSPHATFADGVAKSPRVGVKGVSDPIALLLAAERFESAAVGVAGRPSKYALAWKRILASPDASRRFRELLAGARTIPGRLYGLAGLQYTDPSAARAWRAAAPSWVSGEVDVLFGCIGGRVPILELLPQIADSSWMREWSSDRLQPSP
jgi:hypothetical protein